MSSVGQREKRTQQRVVTLFREQLGYDYLGDWTDREGNAVSLTARCPAIRCWRNRSI